MNPRRKLTRVLATAARWALCALVTLAAAAVFGGSAYLYTLHLLNGTTP